MAVLAVDEVMLREPRLLVPGMQPLGLVRFAGPVPAGSYGVVAGAYVQGAQNGGRLQAVSTAKVAVGPGGRGINTDGTGGHYMLGPRFEKLNAGKITIVAVVSTAATSGPDYVCGVVDEATSYIEDFILNSNTESYAAGYVELFLRGTDGSPLRANTGDIGINDGRVHCIVWQCPTSNTLTCHVDGVSRAVTYPNQSSLSAESGLTEYPNWFATRNVRGSAGQGSDATQFIYAYFRITTQLPNPAELSRDPYSLVTVT